VEATGLIARTEEYPDDTPLPRLVRTAFADVQKDRIECTVVSWGAQEECWAEEHLIVPGDTARPEVWATFAEELDYWAPEALGVDSGYNTSMVYAFCERRRWAFATKGVAGPGRPLVEDEKARRQRLRRQRKKGITVHMIGVDQGKALLYSRLKIEHPGPGYIHFPRDPAFDDEYFAQLTAEKLVTKIRGTRPYQEWVQTRARNEALDCFVGNFAVLRLAGIDLAARAKAKTNNEQPATQPAAEKRESFVRPQGRMPAAGGFVKGFRK
jgi:phage terminase large subunit GpA-like protein